MFSLSARLILHFTLERKHEEKRGEEKLHGGENLQLEKGMNS